MLAGDAYDCMKSTCFSDPLAKAVSGLGHNLPNELRSCLRSSGKNTGCQEAGSSSPIPQTRGRYLGIDRLCRGVITGPGDNHGV